MLVSGKEVSAVAHYNCRDCNKTVHTKTVQNICAKNGTVRLETLWLDFHQIDARRKAICGMWAETTAVVCDDCMTKDRQNRKNFLSWNQSTLPTERYVLCANTTQLQNAITAHPTIKEYGIVGKCV